MKTIPVIAGLTLFGMCLAAYVVMTALHLDTTGLVAIFTTAAGIGGFAAWRNTEVIKEQTNGPLVATNTHVLKLTEELNNISQRLRDKGV